MQGTCNRGRLLINGDNCRGICLLVRRDLGRGLRDQQ